MGNGDGTFRALAPVSLSGIIESFCLDDFDGDGPDMVATIPDSGSTTWRLVFLHGHRDGTFSPLPAVPTSGAWWTFLSADFNHDGRKDLAFPSLGSTGSVGLVLGNGDGTFQPERIFPVSSNRLLYLTLADFDGDQHPDVAVGDDQAGVLTVLFGKGDGTVRDSLRIPVSSPRFVAAADADLDGRPDLFFRSDQLGLLSGIGDGTFRSPVYASLDPMSVPDMFRLEDLNGDGRPDVIGTAVSGDGVRVLLNTPPAVCR
jgi:hypothetical protein